VEIGRALLIQVVSDGRAGIENQALGLAEAVARLTPATICVKRIGWKPVFDWLPSALKTKTMLAKGSDAPYPGPSEPWPDLWIATGRASLPLSLAVRRLSGGKTFVVQTQNPRIALTGFDMIVAPSHDEMSGDNVFEITGSPHRITSEALTLGAAAFKTTFGDLPRPVIAALIGGRSTAFDLTPAHASELAQQMARAVKASGGSLLMTFSRRTPDRARQIMTEELQRLPGHIWDGTGENPLFAFLHHADQLLVTEDSANMATEAASTGKPVHILPMVPLRPSKKFTRLHEDLSSLGATRPFKGSLEHWSYTPLDETHRAARAVLEAMSAKQAWDGGRV
jgi:mitochondrial fission protein ELM1